MRKPTLCWIPSVALAALASSQSQVHTVDGDGGADFLDIQSAIDSAAAGDVVLVRTAASVYAGFTLDGKGLTVLADGAPIASDGATVRNVPPGELAVLRGLNMGVFTPEFLTLEQNQGAVWIEDFTSSSFFFAATDDPLCTVEDSDNVVFTRCGFLAIGPPNQALVLVNSAAAVFETSIQSGEEVFDANLVGRPGITLHDSTLFLFGSTVEGGAGSDQGFINRPARGGPGVEFVGISTLELVDSTVSGGSGGMNLGLPGGAADGPAYDGGSPNNLNRLARRLEVDSPVRAGATSTVHIEAEPGDFVFALWTLSTDVVTTTIFSGRLLVGLSFNQLSLGLIPAGGTLDLPINWGPFPPVLDFFDITAQVGVISAAGVPILGSGSLLHVLNQTF